MQVNGLNSAATTVSRAARRGTPIRSRLLVLAVAGILPLAAMSGWAILSLVQQQRTQVQQAGLEIARALSTAVDAEVEHSVLVLNAIATALQWVDPAGFREPARRVLATQPTWWALVLNSPDGKTLFHSQYPPGAALPPLPEYESFARLLREGRPVVGGLHGPTGFRMPVRVPVMLDGRLTYVLSAVIEPDGMLDLINRQRLPSDWIVSVFDASGTRVARSTQHEESVGKAPSTSLQRLISSKGAEGIGLTATLEGDEVYTAYSRSATTGFVVAVGMPPSFVDAGATRSLAAYGGGILLTIALGVFAAFVVARTVIQPIGDLREAAQALGRREPIRPPTTSLEEIRDVGEALVLAAAERARGETERDELLHHAQDAQAVAEAANRAKDEFLAMLGHELRNPLGAIGNASRLLEDPRVDAAMTVRAKAIIARQVAHMARLTDDLLDAARALTGKIVLQRAPMNLAEAAAHVVSARDGTTAETRRIEPHLEPVWIEADRTRIEQVVGNLLVNAVKYSRDGGTIRVAVRQEGDDAVLRVADDGIGMDAVLVSRVFEPFVQGERPLDRQHGGLGIGLTLVRRLVELHGGTVQAISEGADRGSEFVVRLPATTPVVADTPGRPAAPVAGRRVLLVEDNDDARESLTRLLELDGHGVTAVVDGGSALDAARSQPPDVAFIDLGLPRMDGYELARRLRAELGEAALLVALTGYGAPADRARTRAAGFDLHLVKPVDLDTLTEVLAGQPTGDRRQPIGDRRRPREPLEMIDHAGDAPGPEAIVDVDD